MAADIDPGAAPAPEVPATAAPEPTGTMPQQKGETLSPMKALGLPESPSKDLEAIRKGLVGRNKDLTVPIPKRTASPATKPETTPAPTAPGAKKPAAPAPAAPAPPAPAPVAKIKVGDKEYTPEELAAKIAKADAPPTAPIPPAAPATPAAPAAPDTTAEAAAKQKHLDYLTELTNGIKLEDDGIILNEEEWDKILSGGPDGVTAVKALLSRQSAATELRTRKWLEENLNPILDNLHKSLSPIQQAQQQMQSDQWKNGFEAANPDLKGRDQLREATREALVKHYPQDVAKMTQEQFDTEVAAHMRATIQVIGGAPTPPPTAPVVAAPDPAAPAAPESPKPPTGQLGGTAAPRNSNAQAEMAKQIAGM